MATGGGMVMGSEFYRVLVTGVPANSEPFVREQLRGFLHGEIVSVNTRGTANAIVTLQCQQGLSLRVPSVKYVGGNVTIYNLGTLYATLAMGNVPQQVGHEFFQLAQRHGVIFQPMHYGFTLSGQIDSINNLRTEVDSHLLCQIQHKAPQPAASTTPRPIEGAGFVGRPPMAPSGIAPPPGIPAHIFPTPFSAPSSFGPRLDPTLSILPSTLGASSPATGHISGHTGTTPTGGHPATPGYGPAPTSTPQPSVPSTARPAAGTFDNLLSSPTDHLPPPIVRYEPNVDASRDLDSLFLDDTLSSVPSTKSPSPPLSADVSPAESSKSFTGLDPDALALVQRLPEGDIPGIEYRAREGSVHIQLEGESEVEEAITKFQDVYKKVFAHDRRLRAENVAVPLTCSKEAVKAEIARFEQKYLSTAFVLDEKKRVVRVISQARQFDQAKQFLEEALQKLPKASVAASDAVAGSNVIKISHNRTLTLKKGDIVKEKADILVNAANGGLLHGSGVAGALNAASRGELQRHCDKYMRERRGKEVPVGEVAVTQGGGKLACKHVIHVVGPDGYKHSQTQCEHLVKQAVRNTLNAAERLNATSIVLPAISCGVFGVSKDLVAHCVIDTILGYNYTKPSPILSDIRIVILDGPTHSCFARHFQQKAQGRGRSASHSSQTSWKKGETGKVHVENECPVCLHPVKSPVTAKCGHTFCKECLKKAMERDPYCRTCKTPLRVITGTQPLGGSMKYTVIGRSVPGYVGYKTIQITYTIPSGVQGQEHPNPGCPYKGETRTAYLPYNQEGRNVLKLLQKAFQARLIFKIGTSATTGEKNVVIWGDIHHKTNITGGPDKYGYPDPTYLQTVTQYLAAKGIVSD